jgi:hypothetical protein
VDSPGFDQLVEEFRRRAEMREEVDRAGPLGAPDAGR